MAFVLPGFNTLTLDPSIGAYQLLIIQLLKTTMTLLETATCMYANGSRA